MVAGKWRLLMAFYALIKSSEPIRSIDLAKYVSVSQRTLKNDIADLRSFAISSGARLHSKKGVGYWLEIVDEDLFEPVKEQLDIRFNAMNFSKNSSSPSRTNDIVRRIISEEGYVKLDDIASELYLTRSSIRDNLKEVHTFLSSFDLYLESKRGYGVRVVGEELAKRICMVELYEQHYYKAIPFFKYSEYSHSFQVEEEEASKIRTIFLETLRYSPIRVIDSFINRIVKYSILMRYRRKKGYLVQIDAEKLKFMQQFDQYKVAERILRQLCTLPDFVYDENEVFAIALIFLIGADIYEADHVEKSYPVFYTQAQELIQDIARSIDQSWGIDFSAIDRFQNLMIAGLIPILSEIYFGCSQYRFFGVFVENNSIRYFPLSVCMATHAIKVIEKKANCKLTIFEQNLLAVCFNALIDELNFDFEPRSILICSRNGMQASEVIRRKLRRLYPERWFKKLDIYDFYEVRKLNPKEYDYLLLNFPTYSYKYQIPFMQIDQCPSWQQMDLIYDKILLDGYKIQPVFESFL